MAVIREVLVKQWRWRPGSLFFAGFASAALLNVLIDRPRRRSAGALSSFSSSWSISDSDGGGDGDGSGDDDAAKSHQERFLGALAQTAVGKPIETLEKNLGKFCDLVASGFEYNRNLPTITAAFDLMAPWTSKLPAAPNGEIPRPRYGSSDDSLFDDHRVSFFLQNFPVVGRHVFELGPLEGGHSYMLSKAGATVTSVEASPEAYLKSVLVKDAFDLTNWKILFGDFVDTLEVAAANGIKFDAVVAMGALFQTTEPMKLLELISQVTDTAFFWTHFYHPDGNVAGRIWSETNDQVSVGGYEHTPHCYTYIDRSEQGACLLEKGDIMNGLHYFGFSHLLTDTKSVKKHPHGAEITFLARRL